MELRGKPAPKPDGIPSRLHHHNGVSRWGMCCVSAVQSFTKSSCLSIYLSVSSVTSEAVQDLIYTLRNMAALRCGCLFLQTSSSQTMWAEHWSIRSCGLPKPPSCLSVSMTWQFVYETRWGCELWVDVEDQEIKETCFGVMNMKDEEQQEHETQRHVERHYSSNILTKSNDRYDLLPRQMMKLLITNVIKSNWG